MLRFRSSMPVDAVTNDGDFTADGDGRHAASLVASLVEQAGGRLWIESEAGRYDLDWVFMSDLLHALPDVVDALERREDVVVHSIEQGFDEKLRITPSSATLTIESHGAEAFRSPVDVTVLAADFAALVRALRELAGCLQPDDTAACRQLFDDIETRLDAFAVRR